MRDPQAKGVAPVEPGRQACDQSSIVEKSIRLSSQVFFRRGSSPVEGMPSSPGGRESQRGVACLLSNAKRILSTPRLQA